MKTVMKTEYNKVELSKAEIASREFETKVDKEMDEVREHTETFACAWKAAMSRGDKSGVKRAFESFTLHLSDCIDTIDFESDVCYGYIKEAETVKEKDRYRDALDYAGQHMEALKNILDSVNTIYDQINFIDQIERGW